MSRNWIIDGGEDVWKMSKSIEIIFNGDFSINIEIIEVSNVRWDIFKIRWEMSTPDIVVLYLVDIQSVFFPQQ